MRQKGDKLSTKKKMDSKANYSSTESSDEEKDWGPCVRTRRRGRRHFHLTSKCMNFSGPEKSWTANQNIPSKIESSDDEGEF